MIQLFCFFLFFFHVRMLNNSLNHHVYFVSDLNPAEPRGYGLSLLRHKGFLCVRLQSNYFSVHNLIQFGDMDKVFGQSYSSRCIYQRWERERAQLVAWTFVELVLKFHPVGQKGRVNIQPQRENTCAQSTLFHFLVYISWILTFIVK